MLNTLPKLFNGWSLEGSEGNRGKYSSSSTIHKLAPIKDEEEKDLVDVVDQDELADRLLTQFPTYGSNPNHQLSPTSTSVGWLLGDDDDDDNNNNTSNSNDDRDKQEQEQEQQLAPLPLHLPLASLEAKLVEQATILSAAAPSPSTSKNALQVLASATTNNSDWDEDERNLWKKKSCNTDKKHSSISSASTKSKQTEATSIPRRPQWLDSHNNTIDNKNTALKSPSALDQNPASPTYQGQRGSRQSQNSNSNSFLSRNNNDDNNNSNNNKNSQLDVYNDRQQWMPDQLCKHCYACDTLFTVFRRRHHCRLCGQVFCSSCSAYFVPHKNQTTMRTCKMCFDQVTQKGGLVQQQEEHRSPSDNNNAAEIKDDNNSTTTAALLENSPISTSNNTAAAAIMQSPDSVSVWKTRLQNSRARVNSKGSPPKLSEAVVSPLTKPMSPDQDLGAGTGTDTQPAGWGDHQDKDRAALASTWRMALSQDEDNSVVIPQNNKSSVKISWSNNENEKSTTTTAADQLPAVVAPTTPKEKHMCIKIPDPKEAYRHLGLTAANHMEQMGKELLSTDAPLLWKTLINNQRIQEKWIHKLMTLATRCCATVNPNVKKGDYLDIRPYCKIKVIPGGSCEDCAYISGILFRKTVSHKRMAREINDPKIMLLSGGIEFTRTENRIASLHTLHEQEGKYMEILVGRILKVKPDVLMVGRSVSRKALELLIKANVVLIQHVKSTLMSRISRQTGATIISSTDHVMNQFGPNVLGKCSRFRLVTFRDNEVWVDSKDEFARYYQEESKIPDNNPHQRRSIQELLANPKLSNHERQAALAANMLGESVLDGTEAVKCGLAKRGVAQTYVMLEGCPKHLGCTVVLRGAPRISLKQVKRVFRFLVNVAYNLKLETSFLKARCARIRPNFKVQFKHIHSSSLCVDYGNPPKGRKVLPWNGGTSSNDVSQRSVSGEITAFDHQSILITSVWMTEKTQCCPAEVKGICYYSMQDVSLGQFLRDSCFNLSLKCQNPACKKSVLDHSLSFVHKDGLIKITVEHMDDPLPPAPVDGSRKSEEVSSEEDEEYEENADMPIATWTYCRQCAKVITPLVYISESTWKFSFGKFLEVFFYNRDAIMNAGEYGCSCNMQSGTMLYFGCGKLAARFSYERIRPYGVFVRKNLPIATIFHRREALNELERISMASSKLFVKFDKHIDRVSREARSLFGSAANRPEHLQTVLSELNRIGSEVDHAAMTLQEKIASVSDKCRREGDVKVNEALFRFPWFSRRYLFMLTSAWNERLSATGQAIVAMRKLAASAGQHGDIGQNGHSPDTEELMEGMKRLRQLNEMYSRYNVTDITTVLPTLPGGNDGRQQDEIDDDFEDPEISIDFSDGVDADVLASRRRLYNVKPTPANATTHSQWGDRANNAWQRPTKALGTERSFDSSPTHEDPLSSASAAVSTQSRVTPGGAVKSALTRFFNRGGRESDPYLVDLGIFKDGRPRLEPGVNGIVVPVVDEQLSTIIAYSLSSTEYARQLKNFSRTEMFHTANDELGSEKGGQQPSSGDMRQSSDAAAVGAPSSNAQQRNGSVKSPLSSSQNSSIGGRQGGSATTHGHAGSEKKGISIEQRMLLRNKSHIKHTFRDYDEKGQVTCKFVCTTYWATQFHAVRQVFLSPKKTESTAGHGNDSASGSGSHDHHHGLDVEQCYVQSLSSAYSWAASGGKSGASFARTSDDRFVIKCISRTELQMFLDCAPAYFEYLSKAFFHGLPTVLCKIVGVYQIGYHNRETGKRSMEQVAVMQNIFYNRKISKTFDLKGSLRGRFAAQVLSSKEETRPDTPSAASSDALGSSQRRSGQKGSSDVDANSRSDTGDAAGTSGDPDNKSNEDQDASSVIEQSSTSNKTSSSSSSGTQLDGDFLEFTSGRPMPLLDRAKSLFHMSIQNDTLFLSIINVLDYSILVGIDEDTMELVVGIIDFMRQYDILKQMERVGKSLPMVVGSEAPTIIQPPLYKARFTNAMERYFMTVPCKWTTI